MIFHVWRFFGILAAGFAAFLLATMTQIDPGIFLDYFFRYQSNLFVVFVIVLITAAVFLSMEYEAEEKR